MALYSVDNPLASFETIAGLPLTAGQVFVGLVNQDPETSPQAVWWDADGTIPASLPLATKGGYIVRAGTPAVAYTAPPYSIRIRDRFGVEIFYLANVNSQLSEFINILASPAGAGLIGFSHANTYGTGTVGKKLKQEVYATDAPWNIVADGVTDCAPGINACLAANPGKSVMLPNGRYAIYSPINILQSANLIGQRNKTTLVLSTPNMNGIVVGDGTLVVRNLCPNVQIENIDFNVKTGTAASTSGSCIYLNYVFNVFIEYCTSYGLDGTRKLFNGISGNRVDTFLITECQFIGLAGNGMIFAGTGLGADRCIQGFINDCVAYDITLDCLRFDAFCEGMAVNTPTFYSYDAAGIVINTTLFNFFIEIPDLEVGTGSSGIYVQDGANVVITNGWIGGSGAETGLLVDTGASAVSATGTIFGQSKVDIRGPACSLTGCDIVGDGSTAGSGVNIAAGATGTNITGGRVRQWPTNGILFTGEAGRSVVCGVQFDSNGRNVNGDNWAPGGNAPAQITGCSSDGAFVLAAAASLPVYHGRYFYQVQNGATPVTGMTFMAAGVEIVLMAIGGTVNLTHSGTFFLKGAANAVIPANGTITMLSTGTGWIETARSF